MTKAIVKRAVAADVEAVILNIRDADKREIEDASGVDYATQLRKAFNTNDDVWAAFIDDEIVAIFGMAIYSYVTGSAVPWLISTKAVEKHQVTFLKYCRPVFKKLCYGLDSLVNYVDDRNELAKKWLAWLGFTLHEPVPFGVKMMPFRCFTMEVKNV